MAFKEYFSERAEDKKSQMTITKDGQLGINAICYEKYFKPVGANEIRLFFDAERKIIGIRPVAEEGSFSIRFDNKGKSPVISIIRFLKRAGIEHPRTRAYDALWNEKENLLEIFLT